MSIRLATLFLCSSAFLWLTVGVKATSPIPIVWDDDTANDVDPYVTLPALAKLQDQGVINVLLMVADSANIYSAPVQHLFNSYYQHPNIVVAANQTGYPNNSVCTGYSCNTSGWASGLVAQFDPGDTRANYPECVSQYRRTLAAVVAANSVWIAGTGFATCLYPLTQSGADSISSLTGAQLVQQKVAGLVLCCGVNPSGLEFNYGSDYPDYAPLFALWTSQNGYPPIWQISEADASGTNAGPPPYAIAAANPALFAANLSAQSQRPLWDAMCVLFAAAGGSFSFRGVTYWSDAGNGTQTVNASSGVNSWSTSTASGHHYLANVASAAAFNQVFDGYAYGFGFNALPPLVGTGSMLFGMGANGPVTVK